jgi:two-component system, OmpR family, sensor histidine kinase ArlS
MNYKTRLTTLFVGLFFIVLTSILSFIYVSYSEFRRDEFFERLREKSFNTARLLIDVKEVDNHMLKIIDQNSINKMYDEKILIFDEQDKLIYSSLDDKRIPYSRSVIDQIRDHEDKYYVDEDGDEVVGVHYTGQGHDYVVLASAYDVYGISKLENLRNLVILALLLGTVLIALSSYFYIRQVFRPIDQLNISIQTISENNLKEFVPVKKNRDELDQLAHNYNQMLSRLFKAFESQRAFVRNAAHELKTPLALVHGKLERLEDWALTATPDARKLVNDAIADIDGQATLIESLLLIQRLQSQLPINVAPLRVDELLFESIKESAGVYPHHQVRVDIGPSVESEQHLTVSGNALLLKTCFRNLIENAALYAPGATLKIVITHPVAQVRLEFSNAGDEPLPADLIFEPFYRQTSQQEKPGHGLGLSIVRQITELMKGGVVYEYRAGLHTFELWLPAAG